MEQRTHTNYICFGQLKQPLHNKLLQLIQGTMIFSLMNVLDSVLIFWRVFCPRLFEEKACLKVGYRSNGDCDFFLGRPS